jgi:hypothetical protein
MSDHLPECHRWFANMPEDGCPACEMFRACEQRVLDAAQEAIAALDKVGQGQDYVLGVFDSLSAIETLKHNTSP